ncbi:Chymotrypsin-1 [Pseudolycoriella hygida]|uniref:Chymotrypsin-1 n=1 Tax=Pseudolycoriella hygida TaxID=35572 RepID=A0A9Q0N6K0_9DIPT|nr:Chymotrypsin-1 [Pseudolycoriella hygida]
MFHSDCHLYTVLESLLNSSITMDETEKPFACKSEGCGMSFTNLDHLNVHTKKHAMSLQLSLGNKAAAYVADQTPTPTRLIRNCDEVGLFEDLHLQHVNPFEETFRQAVESKSCASITPTLDNAMIMDDALPQDETTLHTPNVLPFYDLSNCTFKEESITMGDDVIASQDDRNPPECTFKTVLSPKKTELIDETNLKNNCIVEEMDIKIEDAVQESLSSFVVIDKPRPPALILSNTSSLSSGFKKIVDETLSDETIPTTSSQPQNIKTINVKPLPKLTRILPMVPVPTSDPIVKFGTTPKILQINLNDTNKRLLLPKSRPAEEKAISVKDKLKATILKATMECDTNQINEQQNVKTISINDKKMSKRESSDKDDDKLKVSRNRAAAKRYRNKLKLWHFETKQRNIKLEEENNKLRAEVRQLKSLLLAHQDCPVTKAMALGKHIPVGLPKMIVSESNSDNISIINDVAMSPVFLIVNKPIECNSTVKRPQPRIVGGHDATKSYPYQVSVEVALLSLLDFVLLWTHICGGSIISEQHILTAAHCVVVDGKSRPSKKLAILAGTENLKKGGTRYAVCKSVFHERYLNPAPEGVNYDIAIITLETKMNFVPGKLQAIAYTQETTEANTTCVLSGWGSTKGYGKGPHPDNLQELQVTTLSNEECQKTFSFLTENNLCALSKEGEGGCDGDSGGPLVDEKKNVQVGVITNVSGAGCAKGVPDVYSRVSAFYDWIQQFTNEDGKFWNS